MGVWGFKFTAFINGDCSSVYLFVVWDEMGVGGWYVVLWAAHVASVAMSLSLGPWELLWFHSQLDPVTLSTPVFGNKSGNSWEVSGHR